MRKRKPNTILGVVFTTILFIAAFPIITIAAVRNVPASYPTIQAAIDAASSGDTVLVADGTYIGSGNKNIDFKGLAITVISENGPKLTIIDCQNNERGFIFQSGEGPDSVLEGFTIKNGGPKKGTNNLANGAGIYCKNSSSPTIRNNIIILNQATNLGGGICCVGSSPKIDDNVISGNSATNLGGGIYCDENSSPTISGNTIGEIDESNSAKYGGGIYCASDSSPDISNNDILNNIATYRGGGIHCEVGSHPTIFDNIISNNMVSSSSSVDDGGGGISCNNAYPLIENNTISCNTGHKGGGISCWGDDYQTEISYNIISGNGPAISSYGPTTNGGGIYCNDSAPIILNNIIKDNWVSNKGGGITLSAGSHPVISNNFILGNESTNDGGGIQIANSTPTISNNNILNNIAGSGTGGGVYCDGAAPQIANCIIVANGDDLNGCATSYPNFISGDPLFVDPNNGDYHLLPGSPCIDTGTATPIPSWLTTDYEGNPRQIDGNGDGGDEVDIGAFEYIPAEFSDMASFVVEDAKIDFKKKTSEDKIHVKGRFVLDLESGGGVDINDDVIVTIGLFTQTIKMEAKGKGNKWEYKGPKHVAGIKHMTIHWKSREAKFDIRVDNVDLGEMLGWTNPVTISIQIGDDLGSEDITMKAHKYHLDYH